MHWKKETWQNACDGVNGLSRALENITQQPPIVGHSEAAELFLFEGYDPADPMDLPLLSISVQTGVGCFKWDDLTVADHLQGRGLGLLSVKCVMGLAASRGVARIQLDLLSKEGYGFWPAMGAEPQKPLTSAFKKAIKTEALKITSQQPREALLSFVPKAEVSPLEAWRALSQTSNINAAFCAAKKQIFHDGTGGDGVVLDLENPHTLSVLEKRTGFLPLPIRRATP